MLSDINMTPPVSSDELQKLNPYAVTFRYDDRDIELLSRDDAENMVDTIRRWAGEQLNSSDSRTTEREQVREAGALERDKK